MIIYSKQGLERRRRFPRYFMGLFLFLSLTLLISQTCPAYVMPAEQLIGFMAANFSKLETAVLTQFIQQIVYSPEGNHDISEISMIKEHVWMKSPDFYHAMLSDIQSKRLIIPDVTYRQLIISNSVPRLTELLSGLGIDLEQVAFTRIDGVIAYRIGDRDPESPKILIEKERFFPLLLQYRSSKEPDGKVITVRFRDYRQVDTFWYPFEIVYSYDFEPREIYTIIDFMPNVPVNPSVLSSPGPEASPENGGEAKRGLTDEERLREVIKKMEEKYR